MALIEIHADLKALVSVLREIRDILNRAYPVRPTASGRVVGLDSLSAVTPERLWEHQHEGKEEVLQSE